MQTFDQIIERGFVYVDKTDLVYSLATEWKISFLSRSRRFGKINVFVYIPRIYNLKIGEIIQ